MLIFELRTLSIYHKSPFKKISTIFVQSKIIIGSLLSTEIFGESLFRFNCVYHHKKIIRHKL